MIVNVSSVAGIRAGRASVAYNASKSAVNQLTQNIAVDYAAKGIRANAVLPGLINTPMIVHGMEGAVSAAGGVDAWLKKRHANLRPSRWAMPGILPMPHSISRQMNPSM